MPAPGRSARPLAQERDRERRPLVKSWGVAAGGGGERELPAWRCPRQVAGKAWDGGRGPWLALSYKVRKTSAVIAA